MTMALQFSVFSFQFPGVGFFVPQPKAEHKERKNNTSQRGIL